MSETTKGIPLSQIKFESKKILGKDNTTKSTPEQVELLELLNSAPYKKLVKTSEDTDRMADNREIIELKCSVVLDGKLKILPYTGTQTDDGIETKCTLLRESEDTCPFGNSKKCKGTQNCTDCSIGSMSILTQLSAIYISGKKEPLDVRLETKHKIIKGRFNASMETQNNDKQVDFCFPSLEPSIFVRQYTNGD